MTLLCLNESFGQREIVLNTTGYGFDATAANGINPGQWDYIKKFATLKYNGKDASVTAVRLHVQWEQYEPTLGNYQRQKMALAVKAILDLNPNMKVALHFAYLRPGFWNDAYLSNVDIAQTSGGVLIRDNIAHTSPSVFSEYATGRFLSFVNDALSQVQGYSSRILYVAMGNNGSEEFYMPQKIINDINYSGMFEAKALQAWRTKFLPLQFPNQTNVTWGRQTYPMNTAPQPTDGNYNSEIGRDLHRFAGWGLLKLFKGFYDTVKSQNPNIKVLHFISDFGSVQGNNWHLHSSTLVLALELSDGMYHTDGTDQFDLWKKIMGIDAIKGTASNKIAALEFDPIDMGQPSGGSGINGAIPAEWFPRAFKHGTDYLHLAMHFSDNEIQLVAPAIAACKELYLKPNYQPPARSAPTTVNIFPNVFTSQFLFEQWKQIGGQNFAASDLQPKSIRMTDLGYWDKIWNTSNYLPCNFSINAHTSVTNPVTGSSVTLSADCAGQDCDVAGFLWNGPDFSNKSAKTITISAPGTTGTYNYSVSTIRSGCGPKSSSVSLDVTPPLPVKLISFKAAKEKNTTLLSWATSEEVNSESFKIEHSIEGKKWRTIGIVAAGGEIRNATTHYSFTDVAPAKGQNLYRLKMIDLDQTFAYSRIVSVNFNSETMAMTYPNPATDKIIITTNDWEGVKSVRIMNTSGRTVYQSDRPEAEINVENLSSGSYIIGLTRANGEQENVKFVKEGAR
ncbi:MAG: T9SS type A sorting domain-containing protein [Dyadobacter sp.]|uniref:T9SS type A sorting domain-containing protein n=1 Tax=Dyadobacter sp. TaxID=1914288 RepID=UPI0032653662